MNTLQIIPPKPAIMVRRSALLSRVSGAILLLASVGGIGMSSGEEGTISEPDVAIEMKVGRGKVDDNDKSPSVAQSAAAPAATTRGDSSSSSDEKEPAAPQPNALSIPSTPAGVKNDTSVGSEAGKPAAAEAKFDTAVSAAIKDRSTHGRDAGRVLAKPSAISSASVAAKNDLAAKPEDARARNTASNAIAARSAESTRRARQPGGEVDYRSRKSANRVPVWAGSPPIIYETGLGGRAPYAVVPAGAIKKQDSMPLAAMSGIWERVVDAPGVVLSGGKQALYGILDSVW